MKKLSSATVWIIVFVLAMVAGMLVLDSTKSSGTMRYDQFIKVLDENKIKTANIQQEGSLAIISGQLKSDNKSKYEVVISTRLLDEIIDKGKLEGVNLQYRSEEHTSELQSRQYLVCRLLLEKKKTK